MAGAVQAGQMNLPPASRMVPSSAFRAAASKGGADGLVRADADLRATAPMQPQPSLRLCFCALARPVAPLVRLVVARLQPHRAPPALTHPEVRLGACVAFNSRD